MKELNELRGELVYHFTDLARLPWIIKSGELRADLNFACGPAPEFVWATTDKRGCRTASGVGNWRQPRDRTRMPLVRLALDAGDFEPWRSVVGRYPTWTAGYITALEAAARERRDDPGAWVCRVEPLPFEQVIKVEVRAPAQWKILQPGCLIDAGGTCAVRFGSLYYVSRQRTSVGAATRYDVATLTPEKFGAAFRRE